MVQIPLGSRLLSVILHGWLCVVALGNVASIIAHLLTATSFWKGLQDVQGWYSPFNLTNWVYELLLLSPALMAFWLRKWWYSSRNRALLGHSQQAQKRHARQSTPFFQHAIIDGDGRVFPLRGRQQRLLQRAGASRCPGCGTFSRLPAARMPLLCSHCGSIIPSHQGGEGGLGE